MLCLNPANTAVLHWIELVQLGVDAGAGNGGLLHSGAHVAAGAAD